MIDVHCHLLPKIDDGSTSAEQSINQMRIMAAGGVTDAFLTTHYMSGVYHYERADYDAKLALMRGLAKNYGVEINLHPGFEVYLNSHILEDITSQKLTLGSSHYVLLESDLNGLDPDFYNDIYPLLRQGFRPVLAHAERYVSIMSKISKARELIEHDVYLQVNSGSLLGQYGEKVRQTAWLLVRNGWAHLLGSDDHGRSPYGSYFQAIDLLREDLDEQAVDLLTKDFPQMVLHDQIIPLKYVYFQHSHSHSHSRSRSRKNLWERIFG